MAGRVEVPPLDLPIEPLGDVRARANARLRWVTGILLALLALVGVRLVQLALWPAERTVVEADAKRWVGMRLEARRGDIVDRNGRLLATTVSTPNVFLDAVEVEAGLRELAEDRVVEGEAESVDAELARLRQSLVERLAGALDLPVAAVAEALAGAGRYAVLARGVHPRAALEVERLGIWGVGVESENRRFYPEESLAAHALGFVDRSGHGVIGLELQFDEALRGGDVLLGRRRDRRGLSVEDPLPGATWDLAVGRTLHTTLDRTIQRATERALADAMVASRPKAAYAVVLDVRTGDVLAMANAPSFNPNALLEAPADQRNHAIQDAIEPGSVYKPFSIGIGMQRGLVTPDSLVDCEGGAWSVGGARVRDDHPHGVISLRDVIKYSSNIASAKVGLQVGAEHLISTLRLFGFGETTGVDLPWEAKGRLRDPKSIRTIELATTAFGQGTTATPLQLAVATGAIANGGLRMRPRVVSRVVDAWNVPDRVRPVAPVAQVIDPEIARQLSWMMESVVEPGGTGTRARVPGYRVAGKTGTAQKVKDGVYGDARIGSFVGFAPADDPVIAVAVSVDEPSVGSRYGGIVAAPAFAAIVAAALPQLGVAPSAAIEAPGSTPASAAQQAPEDEAFVAPRPDPVLVWSGDGWRLPDLRDLPLRQALAALRGTGLGVALAGSGRVVAQDPPPMAVGRPGQTLNLTLR
jgi:cell division protein FtsI (penicillin-binding protein 3)